MARFTFSGLEVGALNIGVGNGTLIFGGESDVGGHKIPEGTHEPPAGTVRTVANEKTITYYDENDQVILVVKL